MGSSIYFCQKTHPQQRSSNFRNPIEMTIYKVANVAAFKQNSNTSNNLYLPCRYLGKGIYGCTVQVIVKAKKQQRFAQKIVNTSHLVEDYVFLNPALFKELNNSEHFLHVKIIRIEGQKMYILMEKFLSGDLYSFIKKNQKQIDENLIKQLSVKIILALEKIHAKNIIYRNLRPQNILFTSREGQFQLSEFIFSINAERAWSYYGAATYTPPQVYLEKEEGYSYPLDLWMLGVLIYEVLVGETPFEAPSLAQVKQNVLNFHPQNLRISEQLIISQNLRDLVAKLLDPDPQNRITLNQLHRHKFYNGQTWAQDRDQVDYLSIKANGQKQEYLCPNRILYFNFSKSRPLTREFSQIMYQQKLYTQM